METKTIGVVDLFCGIGGLSQGMYQMGFDILGGFDIDKTCQYAFERNNKAKFFCQDVSAITGDHIKPLFEGKEFKVLAGCAPCQPFSSYSNNVKEKDSTKYNLLYQFARLVEESDPDIVTMENVSQILNFKRQPVLNDFVSKLQGLGYFVDYKVVYCPDYGIPQSRKRLVLLASKFGEIELIPPTHTPTNYVTVKEVVGGLPKLRAGECDNNDTLHRARSLTPINLKRIQSTAVTGSWMDWPDDLKLECHKKPSGTSYKSVYGRMDWNKPAPTMTTLCTGLGNGRFGHPEQDRAITPREAALFQTFPLTYEFFPPEGDFSMARISRYIGNAVPPMLGKVTAQSIIEHLKKNGKISNDVKPKCA